MRFDVGFCREVCFNGVIFGAQTVRFKFSHVSNEFENGISFKDGNVKVQELFDRFAEYARRLRNYSILKEDCLRLIVSLFKIKYESDIDFGDKKEDYWEYQGLLHVMTERLEKYINETGENAFSLFNAITDLASNPIERNRYFRRDMNSLQWLAGNWLNAFQNEIKKQDFNIANYLNLLEKDRDKTMERAYNRHTTQSQLF